MHTQLSEKAQNLLACIQYGLQLHDEQSTATHLGDRSQYIGLSDIGRALECPRAALCSKALQRPQATLQKLLTLQRGHWLEHGIGQAINAQGIHSLPQLELSVTHKNTPIKAHFDFVLAWEQPRPAVRILELKSTKVIPETLYASYEIQLYGQASLLAEMWDKPAFNLRNNDGKILYASHTMPEICRYHFGINLSNDVNKVDIEAWVLAISMDDAKPFGPYTSNTNMRNLSLNTAQSLWKNKTAFEHGNITPNDLPYATGFHALCVYCDWNSDCPKFQDTESKTECPEWDNELEKVLALKEERNSLEKKITLAEQELKNMYTLTSAQGDWINTGGHRFKVSSQKGRRTLNKDALNLLLQEKYGDDADDLLNLCENEGKPFQKLIINKIN